MPEAHDWADLVEGGPTVVSVFVNENQGTVLQVEETIGRIAEDLIRAWGH